MKCVPVMSWVSTWNTVPEAIVATRPDQFIDLLLILTVGVLYWISHDPFDSISKTDGVRISQNMTSQ